MGEGMADGSRARLQTINLAGEDDGKENSGGWDGTRGQFRRGILKKADHRRHIQNGSTEYD